MIQLTANIRPTVSEQLSDLRAGRSGNNMAQIYSKPEKMVIYQREYLRAMKLACRLIPA